MRRSLASSRPRSRTETLRLGRCAMDTRRSSRLRVSLLLLLCGFMFAGCPPPGRADEVTDWNVLAIDVLARAGHNNIVMTRGLAMAHLATHDALNAIDRRYEPYLFDRRAEPGAAADAAVAAAMRDVLLGSLAGFGTPGRGKRWRPPTRRRWRESPRAAPGTTASPWGKPRRQRY